MRSALSVTRESQDGQCDLLALTEEVPLTIKRSGSGYHVEVPYRDGFAVFLFEEIESQPAAVWADVTSAVLAPDVIESRRFRGRVNLRDLYSESHYRRELQRIYGDDPSFVALFNGVCQAVVGAVADEDLGVDLKLIQADTEPRYVVPYLVPAGEPGILFAPNGRCKSYLAQYAAACMCTGQRFLGHPCEPGAVLYLDYESNPSKTKTRLTHILAGMGEEWDNLPFIYWHMKGQPLPQKMLALERTIRGQDVRLLVVDSAALACGGNPKDEEITLRYSNCLARLDVASLTIAHVTKKPGEDEYPFGSVFWSNSARITWLVKLEHRVPGTIWVSLHNKKANDEALMPPIGVTLKFRGHEAIVFGTDEALAEPTAEPTQSDQLVEELGSGKKSTKQLAKALGISTEQIRARCHDSPMIRKVCDKGPDGSAVWELVE